MVIMVKSKEWVSGFISTRTKSINGGNLYLKIAGVTLFLLVTFMAQAQEVNKELEYRTDLNLSYKLNKKVKLSFVPEVRFNEDFTPGKYLLEAGLTYKPLKFLALEGAYRYIINPRTEKATEYFNQYAFSAKVDKEFNRFTSGLQIKYTNDADDEITDEQFFRYKFMLDYDIPKSKFTPEIAVEAFQQIGNEAGMYKMRYSAGVDYKLFKNNYLGVSYKLDYYYTKNLNKNIVGIGYKIKF